MIDENARDQAAFEQSERNIHACRLLNTKAAAEYAKHGATIQDIAFAAAFTALDTAAMLKDGNPHDGIEWLRAALLHFEQQHLALAGSCH